jgi:hypothetical protein
MSASAETGTRAGNQASSLLVQAGLWLAVSAWGGSLVAARIIAGAMSRD